MKKIANQKGVALVLSFLVLTLLIVLMYQFSYSTKIDERVAKNNRGDMQNYYGLLSGYATVKGLLERDAKSTKIDTPTESWAKNGTLTGLKIGQSTLQGEIVDNDRSINVNLLADPKWTTVVLAQLKLLAKAMNLKDDVALAIGDYIDKDDKGKFEKKSKNAPLEDLQELLNIKEITPEILNGDSKKQPPVVGLAQFLTLHSAGPININTAPKEVLMALHSSIDETKADAILTYRDSQYFKKVEDLSQVQGLSDIFKKPIGGAGTGGTGGTAIGADGGTGLGAGAESGLGAGSGSGLGKGSGSGGKVAKPPSFKEQLSVTSSYFTVTMTSSQENLSRSVEVLVFRDKENIKKLYWRNQ